MIQAKSVSLYEQTLDPNKFGTYARASLFGLTTGISPRMILVCKRLGRQTLHGSRLRVFRGSDLLIGRNWADRLKSSSLSFRVHLLSTSSTKSNDNANQAEVSTEPDRSKFLRMLKLGTYNKEEIKSAYEQIVQVKKSDENNTDAPGKFKCLYCWYLISY